MSPIDYSVFDGAGGFPKGTPKVVARKSKQRKEAKDWRATKKTVDARDKDPDTESPTCFITGKRLQVVNPLDKWTFRDRAHLEGRSQNKARRYVAANVISVSRGVHELIDASALLLLNKRGLAATSVKTIDAVAWNRRVVAKGDAPCRIRRGLAVVELETVKD